MPAIRIRLSLLCLLQFAVWGAYLTSMGGYLASHGMGQHIGTFYSVQGLVSLFMPALMGVVADRWVEPRRLLALCHLLSGGAMAAVCGYAATTGADVHLGPLFGFYAVGIGLYMPTIALCHSVSFRLLESQGLEPVKSFPPIRMWGTVGFVASMWATDLARWQATPAQFGLSAALSLAMAAYCLSLPHAPAQPEQRQKKRLSDALGLKAFALLRQPQMGTFFLFSILVGTCLQITNGFASPFISSFGRMEQYAGTFGVEHTGILISVSQISETLCVLCIPFVMRRYGIRAVVATAIFAWALRFLFFALGNPGDGLWLLVLSMLVYGVAFDFFNIGGSLYINSRAAEGVRNAAQGLFMMATNGVGSMLGMLLAQQVVNHLVYHLPATATAQQVMQGWHHSWLVFAAYALAVALAFVFVIRKRNHAPVIDNK